MEVEAEEGHPCGPNIPGILGVFLEQRVKNNYSDLVKLDLVKFLGVLGMEIEVGHVDAKAEQVEGQLEWIPSSSDRLLSEVGGVVPVLSVLDPLVDDEADMEDGGQEDHPHGGVVVQAPVPR